MSAVTTGAWSLPGSRLAVRAFLSPRIDELSRKTWQHRGGGGGRVLWGLAGLLLYFLFVETLIVFQEKKNVLTDLTGSLNIRGCPSPPLLIPPCLLVHFFCFALIPCPPHSFLLFSLLLRRATSISSSPLRPLPCDSLFGRYCDITFTHRPLLSSPPLPARC